MERQSTWLDPNRRHFDYSSWTGDAAMVPAFDDDHSYQRVSLANETTGMLSNSGWEIQSGTWKLAETAAGVRYLSCIADGQLKWRGVAGVAGWTLREFEILAGTPTLTQNATDLQIDAVAGEQIGRIFLTV